MGHAKSVCRDGGFCIAPAKTQPPRFILSLSREFVEQELITFRAKRGIRGCSKAGRTTMRAQQSLDSKNTRELFWIYRLCVQHEDDLINNRTTWLVTIQAFLLATFGFSYQKWLEAFEKYSEFRSSSSNALQFSTTMQPVFNNYSLFLLALCAIGFFVGLISFQSIHAAVSAIKKLHEDWKRVERLADEDCHLPELIGGGSEQTARHGTRFPLFLPSLFIVLWLISPLAIAYSDKIGKFMQSFSFLP